MRRYGASGQGLVPTQESALAQNEGFALAIVVILIFAIGIIGMSYFAMAGYETKRTQIDVKSQKAFWLAEGARERTINWVNDRGFLPLWLHSDVYTNVAAANGGTYTVDLDKSSLLGPTTMTATGTYGGITRTVTTEITRRSLAEYQYFTDDEKDPSGQDVWFLTTDRYEGPVHSNGTIRCRGNPTFLKEVSSASDRMIGYPAFVCQTRGAWPVGGNDPRFGEGMDLSTGDLYMPDFTLIQDLAALIGGVSRGPATTIELGKKGTGAGTAAPGWLRYCNTPPPNNPAWTSVEISDLWLNVFYCNNDLKVSGVLDGQLTIVSRKDIHVVDDILYQASSADGTPSVGCDDILGLVAGDNIVIDDIPATSNLVVDGILLALDSSINAQNHNSGVLRGDLTIHGGLIQSRRGPVGVQTGTGVVTSGYRPNYHYDPRVHSLQPPFFPRTNRFRTDSWAVAGGN
jgi:hypothetical protein